jgi:hypothetical protein
MEVATDMKRTLTMIVLLSGLLFLAQLSVQTAETQAQMGHQMSGMGAAPGPEYAPMAAPGKKVPIGNGYYLIYGFDKPPKLGTSIMKVEIFTAEDKKDTSFEVKADADMPSMRGAHASGDRPFRLSNKGDYLIPISIVMPGDWEVKISVLKDGKVIFRGRYNFNV